MSAFGPFRPKPNSQTASALRSRGDLDAGRGGPHRRGAFTSPARRFAAKLLDLIAQSGLPRLEFGDQLVTCSLVQQSFVDFIHKEFKVSNASTIVDRSFRTPGMIDAQFEQNILIRTEAWDNTHREHAVEPSAAFVFCAAGLATANRGHVCHAEARHHAFGRVDAEPPHHFIDIN